MMSQYYEDLSKLMCDSVADSGCMCRRCMKHMAAFVIFFGI